MRTPVLPVPLQELLDQVPLVASNPLPEKPIPEELKGRPELRWPEAERAWRRLRGNLTPRQWDDFQAANAATGIHRRESTWDWWPRFDYAAMAAVACHQTTNEEQQALTQPWLDALAAARCRPTSSLLAWYGPNGIHFTTVPARHTCDEAQTLGRQLPLVAGFTSSQDPSQWRSELLLPTHFGAITIGRQDIKLWADRNRAAARCAARIHTLQHSQTQLPDGRWINTLVLIQMVIALTAAVTLLGAGVPLGIVNAILSITWVLGVAGWCHHQATWPRPMDLDASNSLLDMLLNLHPVLERLPGSIGAHHAPATDVAQLPPALVAELTTSLMTGQRADSTPWRPDLRAQEETVHLLRAMVTITAISDQSSFRSDVAHLLEQIVTHIPDDAAEIRQATAQLETLIAAIEAHEAARAAHLTNDDAPAEGVQSGELEQCNGPWNDEAVYLHQNLRQETYAARLVAWELPWKTCR